MNERPDWKPTDVARSVADVSADIVLAGIRESAERMRTSRLAELLKATKTVENSDVEETA